MRRREFLTIVRVSGDSIAFGFERDRNRGQDIAVVVDERDCRHGGLLTA
jgi:hypothetical protein